MLFYNGGNITSEMQTFETSYTTDEMAFTTFNTLGFEDAVLCGILILAFLGVLGIGLYFANPAFQILAMLIGIGLGIFLIKVNILLGIVFILCNIGGTIIMTIGKQ